MAKTSAQATMHCLTGCVIGEVIGLVLGVALGWPVWLTITVAVILAYIFGFALAIPPIMRREKLTFSQTMKAIWLGEAISIGVMEVVMNGVDYWIGGIQAMSLSEPIFYIGLVVAIPAGFLAAWPVNYVLLKKEGAVLAN
jgi:energy-converting hydrogenase Eha subunit A